MEKKFILKILLITSFTSTFASTATVEMILPSVPMERVGDILNNLHKSYEKLDVLFQVRQGHAFFSKLNPTQMEVQTILCYAAIAYIAYQIYQHVSATYPKRNLYDQSELEGLLEDCKQLAHKS